MDQRTKAFLALMFISLSWGTTWIASRHAVKMIPVFQLAAIRQLLAGLVFLSFFITKKSTWPKGKQWLTILVLASLNLFLTNGLTTWGVKYISAGLAAIIAAIYPLWIVLIEVAGKRRLAIPKKAIIGLVFGFAGVCIIFYAHWADFFIADFRFGIILSLIASLSWALGTIYTKSKSSEFNPYFSIGLQMFLSGVAFCVIAKVSGATLPLDQIPRSAWLDILYLAVVGSILSFLAYLFALQNLPTEQVSIYAYINPVVAVLVGAWLFGEKLTVFIAIGGMVALYGVYLVNASFRKKTH
jgi:drug/metabolite transporter (DMT)-like permease